MVLISLCCANNVGVHVGDSKLLGHINQELRSAISFDAPDLKRLLQKHKLI
jgi:hypothetical protein